MILHLQCSKEFLRVSQTKKEEIVSSKNKKQFREDLSNMIRWCPKWVGPAIVIHRSERQKGFEV